MVSASSRLTVLPVIRAGGLPAEVLYRATIGSESRTPEEVAQDYDVPREAVEEAIDYCLRHADLLQQEREAVLADIRRRALDQPPAVPTANVAGA